VVFGSDWPHPEGLKDPISYVDDLAGLSQEEIAQIMGGNMIELFKLKVPAGV
jgi:predicted TIM-barrel fold metal-dependent hydrolase